VSTPAIDVRDPDPQETRDWLDSLEAVLAHHGPERARFLLSCLMDRAWQAGAAPPTPLATDYVNTIPVEEEPAFPGDEWMEKRIRRIIRWNAAVMVSRANKLHGGIGGHISTYASSASLYEVGFNHYFRGKDGGGSGDQIYFQGHAAPGIYARAFLEGRLTVDRLERFRREAERGAGLSSYPHPRLMPDFWEFPTVSMGLGPISAIYQARFNRYLHARGLVDTSSSRVWAFVGDGEMDEPESLAGLSLAGREGLDNLVFVVNCNLQRLDGPVRGNAKIIQELETVFRGANWNVVKVVWGHDWDPLLARDDEGLLRQRMNEAVDGDFQKYATEDGAYTRQHFFGTHPKLLALVEHLSDDQIKKLRRGGHDYRKIHAAYDRATRHAGQPTAILAHTVKGWTLGEAFEGRNTTHQMKKLTEAELKAFRDLLELPIADAQIEADPPFYHPGPASEEVRYLVERRRALGGFVPRRTTTTRSAVPAPPADLYAELHEGTKTAEGVSTTMAFVRLLGKLLRDKDVGHRIVPIIPDEARTFGMDPLFRQVGIYSSKGQVYEPVDKGLLLYYRESQDGQVLEEGINEAGSMASFTAAATCHATHGEPMIPFYIFYSMFGLQRTGDQAWLVGDARGRGFLMGATAGRTTLNGEGLQHADGQSHALASAIPNLLAYDPAFAYEIAVIVEDGLNRMVGAGEDVFYYITLQNENYPMPPMPAGVREGILRGLYPFRKAEAPGRTGLSVQLLGSGSIMRAVLEAHRVLGEEFGVAADVWAAPSYQQLRNDALSCERWNRLHPTEAPRIPHVVRTLQGVSGPFVAASDYLKLVPDMIARWVPGRFVPLGTDGFGMSDTRDALRRHFEVDAPSIVIAALDALRQDGRLDAAAVQDAIARLGYDAEKTEPLLV
jgi:pyruvate dehydrogenase E1 component